MRAVPVERGILIILSRMRSVLEIDIPNRTINLAVSEAVLAERRAAMEAKGEEAWQPAKERPRKVSVALQAYAAMTTSAARGAVRDVSQLKPVTRGNN